MRSLLLGIFLSVWSTGILGQSDVSKSLNLKDCFQVIENKFNIQIYYLEEYLPSSGVTMDNNLKDLNSVLLQALEGTGLAFIDYDQHAYIIAPKDRIEKKYDQEYFVNKQIKEKALSGSEEFEEFQIGNVNDYNELQPIVIEGFITDDVTNEPLIGATLFIEENKTGTTSDEIGKYELTLPRGDFSMRINVIGYVEKQIKIKVFSSGSLDLNMAQEAVRLGEVIISSEALNENVSRTEIGLEVLDVEEIRKLPSFLGEADVMKSLLLLPGVSSVGEGSGGINVRGGTVDQNLIMQDGMYLFNTSHVLGLFSLFNPDLVKNVNLYKGSMPARFGGRLSSVLDVELKEGSYQQFTAKGGIGLISSRIALETPIQKGVSSIIIGSRFSFSDYMFDLVRVANLRESSAFFYDSNIKFTQRISNKGKFSLSGYLSKDRFKFDDEFDFHWKTAGIVSKLNYVLSDNLSLNLEGLYSRFSSSWDEPESSRSFILENKIEYMKVRPEIIYKLAGNQTLNFGLETNFYKVDPGEIRPTTPNSITIAEKVDQEHGRDFAIYLNDDIDLNDNVSFSVGIRYSLYQSLGPADISLYETNTPRVPGSVVGLKSYNKGEVIKTYSGLEPRFSLKLGFDESSSIKMSYNRTQQFINQVSNTTAVSPVDIWQLSNFYIEPVVANNYSIGYFQNLKDNLWETSIELFYRDIDHLIEYKDLAELLVNTHLETELLSGRGRAYGAELSIQKTQGRFSGRLGYTFSRTERKTESAFLEETINNNNWFLSNYDRPHDISFVFTYQANQRNHLAVNFVYGSGRPITAPVGSFSTDNIFNIPVYSNRNTFRIPAYHRLDISYTIGRSHRKTKSWKGSWTFSIFNVYARKNPFSVFFTQQPFQSPKANRLSVLGSVIPSITYNFSL